MVAFYPLLYPLLINPIYYIYSNIIKVEKETVEINITYWAEDLIIEKQTYYCYKDHLFATLRALIGQLYR